jgi:hypothetical protein
MISSLPKKGVNCNETMQKCVLYNLILPLKPKEKIHDTDHIWNKYGHTVVKPTPHMCNLNPTELACDKIKITVTSLASALNNASQYSRQNFMPPRHVRWRI